MTGDEGREEADSMDAGRREPGGNRKILHVPRRFVTSEWGGTESVLHALAARQSAQGMQPEIHTSLALSNQRGERVGNIQVFRYPYCYPFFGLSQTEKLQLDKKGGNLLSLPLFRAITMARNVRIYHAHALKRLGGEVFTAARLRRKPFVATLHGGVFDVPPAEVEQMTQAQSGKFEWGRAFGALFQSRRILEEADAVVCVGASEADAARRNLPHDRIHHLGNGVDPERFANGDGMRFRQRHGIPPDAMVAACYSRFDYQKDQLTLIEAFNQAAQSLPNLHLVLAGPRTVPDYAGQILRRASESPHTDRIHLLDAIPFEGGELADAFHGCDFFVLPSRHEPFGIVVLEAWSAGRPVAVSQVGGLQALVDDGVDGLFFEPGSAEHCAATLQSLANNPDQRSRLATAGNRKANADYTWQAVSARLEQIYQSAEERVARNPQRHG